MLSAERLRELLNYDPMTGVFTRRVRTSSQINIGDVAGAINGKGYRVIKVNGHPFKAHRLAFLYMTGRFPPYEIDHVNGDRADNRWANLREATHAENQQNAGVRKDSWTGCKGIQLRRGRRGPHGQSPHWVVQVQANGKRYMRRSYGSMNEAAAVYAELARKYHGEFARETE